MSPWVHCLHRHEKWWSIVHMVCNKIQMHQFSVELYPAEQTQHIYFLTCKFKLHTHRSLPPTLSVSLSPTHPPSPSLSLSFSPSLYHPPHLPPPPHPPKHPLFIPPPPSTTLPISLPLPPLSLSLTCTPSPSLSLPLSPPPPPPSPSFPFPRLLSPVHFFLPPPPNRPPSPQPNPKQSEQLRHSAAAAADAFHREGTEVGVEIAETLPTEGCHDQLRFESGFKE